MAKRFESKNGQSEPESSGRRSTSDDNGDGLTENLFLAGNITSLSLRKIA